MLMSHDPKSNWLPKVVNILTPLSAQRMIQNRCDEVIEMQLKRLLQAYRCYPHVCSSLSSDIAYKVADDFNNFMDNTIRRTESDDSSHRKPNLTPFELTNINIRVRDCLLAYCCGPMDTGLVGREGSRSLLSVGLLSVYSSIASNCDRFNLKFTVNDLALHIKEDFVSINNNNNNKRLVQTFGNQRDVDLLSYLKENGFIQLLEVDRIDNLVAVNEDGWTDADDEALAMNVSLGICSIHACVDSLELFYVRFY